MWSRRLHNGDTAVLLYNAHALLAANVTATWRDLSIAPSASMHVRDIWARDELPTAQGSVSARVAPRDVHWLRLTPTKRP